MKSQPPAMALTRNDRYNPLHVAASCVTLVLALMMLLDPLFPPLPALLSGAVGGYNAFDALGQLDGFDDSDYDHNGINNSPNSRGFSGPDGVAIDPVRHRLFAVDSGNNRVLVFNLDISNQLEDRIADNVLGQVDFREDNGALSDAKLITPLYAAYDAVGDRLFVSDYGNNRVMVFDTADITDGMAAVNVLGQPDFDTDDVVLNDTGMSNPRGVAYDSTTSRLFVGSQDHERVLVYDVTLGITDGMAASWVLGQEDFFTDGTNTDQDGLGAGNNLTLDVPGQRLFVDDSPANRIMVWDVAAITNGEDAVNVIGQEDFVSGASGLDADSLDFAGNYGNGLAYDSTTDRLFVADTTNLRVLVFNANPAVLIPDDPLANGPDAINVLGQANFTSAVDSLTQSSTRAAAGLVYDEDNGLLYATTKGDVGLSDNRVMIFDTNIILDNEPAVDGLGQLDENEQPVYTTRVADNAPNAQGVNHAEGVVLDTVNHRLFVADATNNRILVFDLDADDEIEDRTADYVLGQEDFKVIGVADLADSLFTPSGLAYRASTNELFVADQDHHRVLVFDMAVITNGEDAVSVLGQPDFTTTTAATTAEGMNAPAAIAIDDSGDRLFVADANNNRVLAFDLSDDITDGEPAVNVLGQIDFTSSGGGNGMEELRTPMGVAYDGDGQRLFVVDMDNDRVLVFDVSAISDGQTADNELGEGGTAESQLNWNFLISGAPPCAMPETNTQPVFDATNNRLFVPDSCNHRIMVFDTAAITDNEDAVDVVGQDDFNGTSAGLDQDRLDLPEGLEFNPANNYLYVADTGNHRIMVFEVPPLAPPGAPVTPHVATDLIGQINPDDTPNFTAGGSNNGFGGPNAQGLNATFSTALDSIHHRLFVVDLFNHRVLVFNLNADNTLPDHTADFVLGQPDFETNSEAATASKMSIPRGAGYDGVNDRLFVVEENNHRVLVFDTTSITNGEDAVNVLGQSNFTSHEANQGGSASATSLWDPRDASFEPVSGLLAVSDNMNNRVLVFDLSLGITNGMAADHVVGQPNFTSNAQGLSATGLCFPEGIMAEGTTDSLWVADYCNQRVLRFDLLDPSNGPAALNVLGASDFDTDGSGTGTAGGMSSPGDVALIETVGASQRLFVADHDGNRVMVFNTGDGIVDGEDAVDIYGQESFSDIGSGTTEVNFSQPYGVDYDEANDTLYVADSSNNRVMIFNPSLPTPTPGGGGSNPPPGIGFTPERIVVNRDEAATDSRNVLVTVYSSNTNTFTGTVDVLLSNDPMFTTFAAFRYSIPEPGPNGSVRQHIWPKTIAWDLCFGLPEGRACDLGRKNVYARFYVNVPAPSPALVPRP